MSFFVISFYRFVELINYYDMKMPLKDFCVKHDIRGTIILGEEGINATISSENLNNILEFFNFLNQDSRFQNINYQKSYASNQPFTKLKVRLKKEIVNIGIEKLDSSLTGDYINPEDWDQFIKQPDVYLIDTRNDYEVKMGQFKNAVNPNTKCFREFPLWVENYLSDKNKKIAMYCTGGIRCEKSTSFLKSIGFKQVYQLKGGILNYLKTTKNNGYMWHGNCFVFDDRISVDCDLSPSKNIKCIKCHGNTISEDLKSVSKGNVICNNCRNYIKLS